MCISGNLRRGSVSHPQVLIKPLLPEFLTASSLCRHLHTSTPAAEPRGHFSSLPPPPTSRLFIPCSNSASPAAFLSPSSLAISPHLFLTVYMTKALRTGKANTEAVLGGKGEGVRCKGGRSGGSEVNLARKTVRKYSSPAQPDETPSWGVRNKRVNRSQSLDGPRAHLILSQHSTNIRSFLCIVLSFSSLHANTSRNQQHPAKSGK